MAELPLVEAMRSAIAPHLEGNRIENASVLRDDCVGHPDARELPALLAGKIIQTVRRRGKMLSLQLSSGASLTFHFRMNGTLSFVPSAYPMQNHTHLVLSFGNATELRFRDPRCLAKCWYVGADEEDIWTGFSTLGPDALDTPVTTAYLTNKLRKLRRPIKAILLDQQIIAGIGNIYADEILFAAHLSPLRRADSLTSEELSCLADAIKKVITSASELLCQQPGRFLGTSFRSNRGTRKVYGKRGRPCPTCGTPLAYTRVSSRSTVYCPRCQK